MNRFLAFPAVVILLLACSFQCRHDDNQGPVLKGKLVLSPGCVYVIQVLEGNIPPEKVTASWKSPANGITYTRVFSVMNICTFGGYNLQEGDVFTFELDNAPPPQTCMNCQALIYYPTPSPMNAVKNVQKLK
jgi:hypothetical protein